MPCRRPVPSEPAVFKIASGSRSYGVVICFVGPGSCCKIIPHISREAASGLS
jgi:hypothetical protein